MPNRLPKVISPTGTRRVSKIVSVERCRYVTIICCIKATGYYLHPFLVFARKRMLPELVERAPPGTVGHCSDNGWSNGEIFLLFFKHFNRHVKPAIIKHTGKSYHHGLISTPHYPSSSIARRFIFRPLKAYYSQACDNFMVIHPVQAITDKNVSELLSIAYFKVATVGNAVNGFKECGIEPRDLLVFNEHDFTAAEITYHGLTAAPRGQRTETPNESPDGPEVEQNEESGHLGNYVFVKSKLCRNVFDFKPSLPKERPCAKKRESHSQCASVITSTTMKGMLVQKEAQKKLKLDSFKKKKKKKTKKSERPTSMMSAQTSKQSWPLVQCLACDEIYVHPTSEDSIECCKLHMWWHEDC
ncbi:hypothetical protein PR048_009270 [Dryococelus australis]|uniref:Uncharacterized protein n=1 Tax=Dryococelus australis TaxID=614101 RepID=A0ABQ9HZE1_9NEOP|nr:hypothetical protein PR048_009270 [Dryococelus australis]